MLIFHFRKEEMYRPATVSDVEKQLNTDDDITVGDDSKSNCLYFERQNLIL